MEFKILNNNRGIILLFVFFSIAVLAVLSAIAFSRSMNENYAGVRHVYSSRAFWLAEAGVQEAVNTLNSGNWTGYVNASNFSNKTITLGTGTVTISIADPGSSAPEVNVSGSVGNVEREIQTVLSRGNSSMFQYAMFGKNNVIFIENGKTDSYNSSNGSYGGSNRGSNGDVASNGNVTLWGSNVLINGSVGVGDGGNLTQNATSDYTGELITDVNEDLADVEINSTLSSTVATTSISSGCTIAAGTYKKSSISIASRSKVYINGTVVMYLTNTESDALSITGQAQIIINNGGSLTIYTDGRCKITGNGILNNYAPEKVQIYSTYTNTEETLTLSDAAAAEAVAGVKIAGNGDFNGAVYAPNSIAYYAGNGNISGATVSKLGFIAGNAYLHYDEALQAIGAAGGEYTISTWTEQNNPYPLTE